MAYLSWVVSASAACGLNLITAEYTPSRTSKQLTAGIARIVDLYARGGYQVGTILMDNEFKYLKATVTHLVINTTAAKKHVPEIEWRIRLTKERGRGILNTLPFQRIPKTILIELIYHVMLWLNAIPVRSGISDKLSPSELVIRQKLDFKKHCKVPFGSYCKVHNEPTPTNGMQSRTHPAMVLSPTGNLQDLYKFFCLQTGKKLKQRAFTPYPIPDSIIKQVDVRKQGQPVRQL